MKTHTFMGRRYYITTEKLDGWCSTYKKDKELVVNKPLDTRVGLETALHESLHACQWPASEARVEQTAYDIARFLWRLGYRKQDIS
jgi:hypothetical protein